MLQKKSTGEYLEAGATFANTMVGGLLHEIVHYYAYAAVPPKRGEEETEVYYVSDCVKLKGRDARLMPNCYVYYALSKLGVPFPCYRVGTLLPPSLVFISSFLPALFTLLSSMGTLWGLRVILELNSAFQVYFNNAICFRMYRKNQPDGGRIC